MAEERTQTQPIGVGGQRKRAHSYTGQLADTTFRPRPQRPSSAIGNFVFHNPARPPPVAASNPLLATPAVPSLSSAAPAKSTFSPAQSSHLSRRGVTVTIGPPSIPKQPAQPLTPTRPPLRAPTQAGASMSYNRPLSPGGRRINNPARTSDLAADQSYYRHGSYASPRSSNDRVIPISTQTIYGPRDGRDSYSGRPRRSSLVDTARSSAAPPTVGASTRSRPTVIQGNDAARPTSPPGRNARDNPYVTPAQSKPTERKEHKKIYSVDDGSARLIAEEIPAGGGRLHKRRESLDRSGGYRASEQQSGRGRSGYHLNGPARREKPIDEDDAYSYTEPAAMYTETEPRWRPRRGSVDRGLGSRERPSSALDMTDQRRLAKEVGPPPSTRGWDKINSGIDRSRSTRDVPHSPVRSGTYEGDQYYKRPRANSNDRRNSTAAFDNGSVPLYAAGGYDDERRDPRHHERRWSASRPDRADRSVERRGFGIRADSQDRFGPRERSGSIDKYGSSRERSGSIDRYGPTARGSDESFSKGGYSRDPGHTEPHRRDTAPEISYHDERRLEQEKRDRERIRDEQREREWINEARVDLSREQQLRNELREREYDSRQERRRDKFDDYDSYDRRDRDRDREKERDRDRRERDNDSDRERERYSSYPPRTSDRQREHPRREQQEGGVNHMSGAAQVAGAGLVGAAAIAGLKKTNDSNNRQRKDERNSDNERDRDEESERERERERSSLQLGPYSADEQQQQQFHEGERERDHATRIPGSFTSEEPQTYDRDRLADTEADRGLGFAFEAPPDQSIRRQQELIPEPVHLSERASDPMIKIPPPQAQVAVQTSTQGNVEMPKPALDPDEEYRRRIELHKPAALDPDEEYRRRIELHKPAALDPDEEYRRRIELSKPALDPDEEYRRRMEQVQRELGGNFERHGSDSDADRERRRREREQRQRERETRHGDLSSVLSVGNSDLTSASLPQSFYTNSTYNTNDDGTSRQGLARKPSILDAPMLGAQVQVIDNTQSERKENRVRIVEPPNQKEEESKPKGILKKPTEKFPEDLNAVREGVAPLKDATKKGVPPGARWTKIKRELVNPEALEEAKERFEERQDCVIVLRVLSRPEIQKLADRTAEIRGKHTRSVHAASTHDIIPSGGSPRHDATYAATLSAHSPSSSPQLYPETSRVGSDTEPLDTGGVPRAGRRRRHTVFERLPNQHHETGSRTPLHNAPSRRKSWASSATSTLTSIFKHALSSPPEDKLFARPSSPSPHDENDKYAAHTDSAGQTEQRYEEERRAERKAARRRERERDRRDRDEYLDDSEDEFTQKAPMLLEAPTNAGAPSSGPPSDADYNDRRRDRDRDERPYGK